MSCKLTMDLGFAKDAVKEKLWRDHGVNVMSSDIKMEYEDDITDCTSNFVGFTVKAETFRFNPAAEP